LAAAGTNLGCAGSMKEFLSQSDQVKPEIPQEGQAKTFLSSWQVQETKLSALPGQKTIS
jgi:hypothetical protein